eukprot:TRINITY_DN2642_c0_g3_i1.p1 TRINITY_DN2642_c0_g3~~TRINITY_DN2642_c0_g3_i1.p1  ORF type:complete len:495 (+),score=80.68 TRINITY_DN2642_c0_g3_i1:70-1554(+)
MAWCFRPAWEQAQAVQSKQVTSVALVEEHIARIERLDGNRKEGVNAVVVRDFSSARKRAAEADEALARGELWGPLHGVPVTIKEAFFVTGLPTTAAIPGLESHVADSNALNVQRLVDAGVVVLGKTNIPPFCADWQSANKLYGRSRNPWDLTRTPGGSSGGSAASLACGFAALELGSDIGGSIRVPAHFSGVCGHKPSYGLGHIHGHAPAANHRALQPAASLKGKAVYVRKDPSFHHELAVSGPLARCCEDLELAMRLLARPEPVMEQGGWSYQLPAPRCTDVRKLRLAAWLDSDTYKTDREYLALMEEAVTALERAGATVDRSARPFLKEEQLAEVFKIYMTCLASNPALSMEMPSLEAFQSNSVRRNFVKETFAEFFQHHDVLLCPVMPIPAFPHTDKPMPDRKFSGAGIRDFGAAAMQFWPAIIIVADLPSTVVPVGLTPSGLPCGIQIVAPNFHDLTSIEVGKMLQSIHPPCRFQPPPGFGLLEVSRSKL